MRWDWINIPLWWLIHWWCDLPWWLRVGCGLLLVLISTLLYFFGDILWFWGWIVGGIFILFGFPSDPEKKGYRF